MVGLFYVDTKVIILRKLEFTAYPNFSAVDSNQRINSTSLTAFTNFPSVVTHFVCSTL